MSYSTSGSKMFENMSVSDLKTYLRERGVSVNGHLKPALIEKMMLPIVTEFEKGNDNKDIHNFIIHDMEISDPFSASHNLVNNFVDSPPFGLYDIFNYLIFHSSDYDKHTKPLTNIVCSKMDMSNRF